MRRKLLLIALFAFTAIPLIGYSADNSSTGNQQTATTKKKPLYWVDPMEPKVHYSAPGKSPMGMDLVPVYPKQKKSIN
uniref:heavy metal-binding domain-containing protein n=1 Tax=Fulvivirga sp. TaxID=1931237 RepID=UPI00404AA7AB